MRRLLPIAALLAVIVGTIAGVTWANADPAHHEPAAARAPLTVPATAPAADQAQPGAAGYRSSAAIAAAIARAAAPASQQAAAAPVSAASASVTVTATVLPMITIQLDRSGDLASIVSNTPDRDATAVLFGARSADGAPVTITPALWRDVRSALARAQAGTGTIWSH